MNTKAKGTGAERELVKLLWQNNWAAIRVAGSGSSRYPSPDILAGKGKRKIAIESKITKTTRQYFSKKEIEELNEFSTIFGAEPWVGIKFKNKHWKFLTLEDLKDTGAQFGVTSTTAELKGLSFEEVINGF